MSYPKWLYLADGSAMLAEDETQETAALAAGWADTPAAFGIETCPGSEPDAGIAVNRAADVPEVPAHGDVEMPAEGTPLDQMTREQLIELAANRTVAIDKRWGTERIREALAD